MFSGSTPIVRWLRWIAFFEGISFLLLLFVTMPLKYLIGLGMPNSAIGMAHGFLFIGYIALVIMASVQQRWKFWTIVGALAASIVPFGTFYADDVIFAKSR